MPAPTQWSDLQVFLAVCERESVGAAAVQLGINHSTVLRRLSRLEEGLGARLFDRLPSGYVLTAQGRQLAADLAGLGEQIAAAQREIGGDDAVLSGPVRLTAPDVLLPLILPALAAFQRQHPQVEIALVQGNAFASLAQREADIAVRGANRVPDTLIGQEVGQIRTALYGTVERFAAEPGPLESLPWIGHTETLAHLASARWIAQRVPVERIVMRVDSLLALADAVVAGIGVGWLLCPLAEARPGLRCLRPPLEEFNTRVWVLWHADLRRVARVRSLAAHLAESLRRDLRLHHPSSLT
ncbi:LysR family transcriptional regulator [Pseudomarimonas salicorniae]|uniref:LysR family transcriptional regulator n=1 Tax=Pseudomarimonas salicorniae TaxID=2933270 RepID=A0ABT0GH00_9GAMM|nr:LysR family transcriptional regulator [Lysobacter sp. CAU 1642]MCK7593489.1 LysR family transcriptional regulator [Lysobacter sp. CAU 1642]